MGTATTDEQWNRLLDILQADRELRTGQFTGPNGKPRVTRKWEQVAEELNGLDGATKSGPQWKTAFINLKSRAKKAYNDQVQHMKSTGGGSPYKEAEEALHAVYKKCMAVCGKITATGNLPVPHPLEMQRGRALPYERSYKAPDSSASIGRRPSGLNPPLLGLDNRRYSGLSPSMRPNYRHRHSSEWSPSMAPDYRRSWGWSPSMAPDHRRYSGWSPPIAPDHRRYSGWSPSMGYGHPASGSSGKQQSLDVGMTPPMAPPVRSPQGRNVSSISSRASSVSITVTTPTHEYRPSPPPRNLLGTLSPKDRTGTRGNVFNDRSLNRPCTDSSLSASARRHLSFEQQVVSATRQELGVSDLLRPLQTASAAMVSAVEALKGPIAENTEALRGSIAENTEALRGSIAENTEALRGLTSALETATKLP